MWSLSYSVGDAATSINSTRSKAGGIGGGGASASGRAAHGSRAAERRSACSRPSQRLSHEQRRAKPQKRKPRARWPGRSHFGCSPGPNCCWLGPNNAARGSCNWSSVRDTSSALVRSSTAVARSSSRPTSIVSSARCSTPALLRLQPDDGLAHVSFERTRRAREFAQRGLGLAQRVAGLFGQRLCRGQHLLGGMGQIARRFWNTSAVSSMRRVARFDRTQPRGQAGAQIAHAEHQLGEDASGCPC